MRFLTISLFLISVILFFSVNISPEVLPYAGLMPLLIPLVIGLNLLFLVVLIMAKRKLLIVPLIALILGWKFVVVTFQWNSPLDADKKLEVLSYNVHLFNYAAKGTEVNTHRENVFRWIREHPAEVKCLQEMYQDYTTPTHNAIKRLSEEGKINYSYHVISGDEKRKSVGIGIFSKFPIINEGKIFDNKVNNGVIFVDIKVDKDTLRIYNGHLESMSIDAAGLANVEGIRENYRETLKRLKKGINSRAAQVNILNEHIQNSPHPVIIMGDFNDVPFSYTYFTFRKILDNAFEKGGKGFGFTFNRVLVFLRIDHIFNDMDLEVIQFKTHKEVDYSDHFPISASYTWSSPFKSSSIDDID
ncbi:endonuclease/exonuclease/phosphatase family protein [Pararhodonellum marinum]|uniref:endonuclease/exonuclease/phosphatase family protein n=1 Tax=Pararhodonellum marinum TaxID=2755358 RepID=UPI001890048B|nr:endonuclease/exonuclease/phosphatase family protein [Pararhodonellum marinum]